MSSTLKKEVRHTRLSSQVHSHRASFNWAKGLFDIAVTVVVQSAFRLEMHQNDVFFI